MANSKLIIVEGPQGAGKTTITDHIRYTLKHVNLYRLTGISDVTLDGKRKIKEMYEDLLDYIKKLENKNMNLLFDRTFFSEENYCRLGKKEYSFTDVYKELLDTFSKLDFEIYYINLYLEDTNLYVERLKRDGKAIPDYAKFAKNSSEAQQKVYLEMAEEIKEKYPSIKVLNLENSKDMDNSCKEVMDFITK